MKYEKDKEHNMELRKTEKFKVMHANTGRLEKSSIIYMQHLLNQLTWNKKIILFGRDSRNPRFNEIAQSCMHFLINLVVPSLWIWVVRYIIWNKPYSLTHSNIAARSEYFWQLGSQDAPLFAGLVWSSLGWWL